MPSHGYPVGVRKMDAGLVDDADLIVNDQQPQGYTLVKQGRMNGEGLRIRRTSQTYVLEPRQRCGAERAVASGIRRVDRQPIEHVLRICRRLLTPPNGARNQNKS